MSDFNQTAYTDAGTGAVKNPMEKPVTVEALEHLDEPTGASPNPPAETTYYFDTTDEPAKADTKQVQSAQNKAVKAAKKK